LVHYLACPTTLFSLLSIIGLCLLRTIYWPSSHANEKDQDVSFRVLTLAHHLTAKMC